MQYNDIRYDFVLVLRKCVTGWLFVRSS